MNINIKTKIILAALVPLIAIFYFVIGGIIEKNQIRSEVNNLEILSNLSIKISAVVHELQRERGRTSGFMGADGKKFVQELSQQRILTDEKNKDLNIFIENFKVNGFEKESIDRLQSALQKLDSLEEHRAKVGTLSMSDEQGIEFYTELNTLMIDVIAFIPKASPNAEISILLSGYVNFIKGKEKVGIERAIITNAFIADRFSDDDNSIFNYFTSLISAQDVYFDSFKISATKNTLDFFEAKTLSPVIAEVQEMRDLIIRKHITGGFGVDAFRWFDAMTAKIDILKEVEDRISAELHLEARNLSVEARNDLIMFLVIAFVVLLLTIILSASLLLTIKPITQARDVAIEISRGNMDVEIDTSGNDEIAELSRAIDKMRESLKVILEEYEKKIK